jgi:type III pantothenate kinase
MKLQIDIGNTQIKWRTRNQGVTLASGRAVHGDYAWLAAHASATQVWVSSVVPRESGRLREALHSLAAPSPQFACAEGRNGDLISGYSSPQALGVDRWMALLGARQQCHEALVVVDAGTALTVDVLEASGQHLGGYIGPGLRLMRAALAGQSSVLDVPAVGGYRHKPGDCSAAAIEAALVAMGCGLLASGRAALVDAKGAVQMLYTGGDGDFWRRAFDCGGQYVPELVLDGVEAYFTAFGHGSKALAGDEI